MSPTRGVATNVRSTIGADHIHRIDRIQHSQSDSEVGVGSDVLADHAAGSLGGQHKMNAQASPPLGDPHQRVDEVGQLGDKGGELVDHHHQAREWFGRIAQRSVRLDRIRFKPAQKPFAIFELGIETSQRPLTEVRVEVGDHPDGMREVTTTVERAASLVVDEDKREMVDIGRRGHRRDHRSQEFTLARPRRPTDERMGAIGNQVDQDRTVLISADWSRQPAVQAPR